MLIDPKQILAMIKAFFKTLMTVYTVNSISLSPTLTAVPRGCVREYCRVSEPACFGAAPAPGIFYPEPALAPGKRENNF